VTSTATIESDVWEALRSVMDPEIPAVSVVEMGMIGEVSAEGHKVRVVVLPTFTGCPAISVILDEVRNAAASVPQVEEAVAETSFSPPWTTDRITEKGRRKLEEFGLAPPSGTGPVLITQIGLPDSAVCPFCGSRNTRNENLFGPTPCRALYYCESCRNPFEQFKEV
jgi:ring-1,2-phenylacetyl-CoA epoxidase subunit PaaD